MPETVIAGSDERLRWDGAVSVQRTEEWTRAWRLPYERLDLFPGGELRARAAMPAGVRLVFGVDATEPGRVTGHSVPGQAGQEPLRLDIVTVEHTSDEKTSDELTSDQNAPAPNGGPSGADAPRTTGTDGDRPAELVTVETAPDGSFGFDLPAGRRIVEIWLPQFGDFLLRDLTLSDGARLWPYRPTQRPRWLAYGSSITQCRSASTPTRTWPARAARSLNLDLTCLGFGGECHLDPMVARTIADRPADLITLCLGINVHGGGTFNGRSFLPAVLGFVATIRDGHPDLPVVLISPIVCPDREETPNQAGMTLRAIRDQVAEAHQLLQSRGDANLHLVNGLDLLGPSQAGLLGDGLHPTDQGYAVMADAIAPTLGRLLPR